MTAEIQDVLWADDVQTGGEASYVAARPRESKRLAQTVRFREPWTRLRCSDRGSGQEHLDEHPLQLQSHRAVALRDGVLRFVDELRPPLKSRR